MITGGNATVFVTDMDKAVEFYTQVLGLTLRFRAENYWAEVQAGSDLVIGLHPASPKSPAPGTPGAVQIGLLVGGTMEDAVAELTDKGITFDGPIIDDASVRLAYLKDPDGNVVYLCEHKAVTS